MSSPSAYLFKIRKLSDSQLLINYVRIMNRFILVLQDLSTLYCRSWIACEDLYYTVLHELLQSHCCHKRGGTFLHSFNMEGKSEILHQTNESESTTEAKYYFAKLLLRDSLFGKMTLCINRH